MILEIQDTILKSTTQPIPGVTEDFIINQNFHTKDGVVKTLHYVYLREFALKFLEYLGDNFEIIIYTQIDIELTRMILKTIQDFRPSLRFDFVVSGKTF